MNKSPGPRPVRDPRETYDQWMDRLRDWIEENREYRLTLKRRTLDNFIDMIRKVSR